MKIALIYQSFLPVVGGIEILMSKIGEELVQRGHDVTVFTSNSTKEKKTSLKANENIDGIHVRRFKLLPFPYDNINIAPEIIPALLSADIDIVHVFSYFPSFLTNISCIVSRLKARSLVITPIFNPIRTTLYRSLTARCLYKFFDEEIGVRLLKMADCVTALTQSEADFFRKRGVTRIKVIPEGIHIPDPPSEAEIKQFREKYNLEDRVVLSVGRIIKYKGLDLLVKAFSRILEDFPEAKLLLIGEDWGYLSTLEDIVHRIGCDNNVLFTGLVNELDLACAYETADVVVHPSLFETFARIALEAWAHKKPIICFDLGAPTNFVTPDTGVLVRYGVVRELSRALFRLLSNKKLCRSMGKNGFRLIRSRYSWTRVIDEIEVVYQSITKGNRSFGWPTSLFQKLGTHGA